MASGAALAAAVVPPPYDGMLIAVSGYLVAIDKLGGNNGVNVSGAGQVVMATPRGVPIVGAVINIVLNIGNADGTASFSSDKNWFMHANTDNKEVWTNVDGIYDDRDRFFVEVQGNGQIALKSKGV